MNISVVGGKIQRRNMTLELQKKSPKDYETMKIIFWFGMLKKRMKPVKWLKPNRNGTGIKFEMVKDQSTFDEASAEFEAYLKEFNEQYQLDLQLTAKE